MTLTKRMETLIRSLRSRRGRRKHGLCVCEGRRACRELVARRPDLMEFAVCSAAIDASDVTEDFIVLPPERFGRLSSTINSQGILIVATSPEPLGPEDPVDLAIPFVVILDGISDPGNLGTILRTLKAVGLDEAWLTKGTADPFGDKVIRSALGLQFSMRFRHFEKLEDVSKPLINYHCAAQFRTDPHQGDVYHRVENLFDHSALVFGGEAHGAGELSGAKPVRIAMPGGVESINVAQATTVLLFDYVRRRLNP